MNYKQRLSQRVLQALALMEAERANDLWEAVTPDGDLNIICDFLYQHQCHRVLELGTWHGHTSIAMAGTTGHVTAIDPNPGALDQARHYADLAGVSLECVVGRSTDAAVISAASGYDAIFLDTTHTYDDTRLEISIYALKTPMLLLHDASTTEPQYDRSGKGGVRRAFYEWLAAHLDYRGTVCETPDYPNSTRGVGVLFRP